jgi:hypothetical protein
VPRPTGYVTGKPLDPYDDGGGWVPPDGTSAPPTPIVIGPPVIVSPPPGGGKTGGRGRQPAPVSTQPPLISYHDLEQRLGAFWDGVIPFRDPFSDLYQDCYECWLSQDIGLWTRRVEIVLATPLPVAGAARVGLAPRFLGPRGSLLGRGGTGLLNRNDYLRFGWGWFGSREAGRELIRFGIGSRRLPFWGHLNVW